MFKFIVLTIIALYPITLLLAYLLQDNLVLHPKHLAPNYAFVFNQTFEEYFYEPQEGIRLNALYFPSSHSKPKGFIFYLHGNATNIQRYGNFAIDFTEKGFDIFMFDYRNFGKSTGKPSEAMFHADAQFMYHKIREQFNLTEQDIIIYGRSLGSGIATKLASNNNARSLILETPFYNIADVVKKRFPFIPCLSLLRYTFRTDLFLPQVASPVYIFHGTNDKVVPYDSGIKLRPFLTDPTNFITITGGKHNNLRDFDTYHHYLALFMNRY